MKTAEILCGIGFGLIALAGVLAPILAYVVPRLELLLAALP